MIIVSIEYILEILKYYLLMRYFIGVRVRNSMRTKGISLLLILLFSMYVTHTLNNPIVVFMIFVIVEMLLLFKERVWKIVTVSIWLVFFVSMLDQMFKLLIELLSNKIAISLFENENIRGCFIGALTISFISVLLCMIKRVTGTSVVKFSAIYYLYFMILTMVEGIMVGVFEELLNEFGFTYEMYIVSVICIFVLCINVAIVVFLAVLNDGYKQRDILNNENIMIQEKNYIYLKEVNEDIRRFKHDYVSHMQMLKKYIDNENYRELAEYIHNIAEDMHMIEEKVTVNNGMVDAILNQYAYEARENRIAFEVTGQLFEKCHIKQYDLCIIFSNLLKNAMRAASESKEKYIKVKVERNEDNVNIKVVNSYGGTLIKKGEKYITTKEDSINHGLGMDNARRSVKRYDGIFEVFEDGKEFIVYIEM